MISFMSTSDPRETRRAARKDWPMRKGSLHDPPQDDLSDSTTAEERLQMVWTLTLEAWELAGLPMPDYERHNIPMRVIRRDSP